MSILDHTAPLVRIVVRSAAAAELTNAVPDAALNVPATVLLQKTCVGGTRMAYDAVGSTIEPYQHHRASGLARRLDEEILGLLRRAADC